ncbi:MAG: type I glyceraldehyde-3-phosphate dehydrogenase [Candidatus Nealsonbacteria bacterium]|nr:type I glyceraldehyde-3-phosphate dehydrogenase [Candidatus Nealsonbacteria bacterium]
MIKVAINGFGRIGRAVFRNLLEKQAEIEVVAINDLTDPKTLCHLLRYDSIYGVYKKRVKCTDDALLVNGTSKEGGVKIFAERNPADLPWKKLRIDVVLECTGVFRNFEGAKKHLSAGAKYVIISAPSKDPEKIPSFVLGVNEEKFDAGKHKVVDMASCTTNCLSPVAKVLDEEFGVVKGFMTTVHSYTNDQNLLDLPHKDLRRARAAALNIVPTTTGAAKAVGQVIPELKGKLDGIALRIPTPTVSVVDLVCEVKKKTNSQEVNYAFKEASKREELRGVLGIEDAPLVSSDYVGNSFSSVVDHSFTRAIGNMVKVLAWYDNEHGYACRLADFAAYLGRKISN